MPRKKESAHYYFFTLHMLTRFRKLPGLTLFTKISILSSNHYDYSYDILPFINNSSIFSFIIIFKLDYLAQQISKPWTSWLCSQPYPKIIHRAFDSVNS